MVTKDLSIKKWYCSTYPEDELGRKLNDIPFSIVAETLVAGNESIYPVIGVEDTKIVNRLLYQMTHSHNKENEKGA